MNVHTHDPSLVSLSAGFYRLLLYAYPSGFRREYGPHMSQAFRDYSLRVYGLEGPPGMLALWATVSIDLVQSVLSEHISKGVQMSSQRFIQISAWSMIVGGVFLMMAFSAQFFSNGPYDPYNFASRPIDRYLEASQAFLIPASILLITIGVAGLYARYAQSAGNMGKITIGISTFGGILTFVVILPIFSLNTEGDFWWGLLMIGMLALFGGLLLFGIVALRKGVMRLWNWLPLVAGLYLPANIMISTIYEATNGGWLELPPAIDLIGWLITGLALVGIGYVMLSDLPEEQALSPA